MRNVWILLLVFSWNLTSGQSKPGIYLTMNLELELCDNKMKLLNSEKIYCISEEPILEVKDFARVDTLVYDSLFEMRKFRIVLTKRGKDYVSTMATKLPDHKLALIVNGILVSTIDLDGIFSAGSIMIWDQFDSQAMEWIHRSLVKEVTKQHKKS